MSTDLLRPKWVLIVHCSRQQETESLKRLLSETHEQEVLLLKEEINSINEAMSLAQTSEEHLKAQVTQLIQENEALKMDLEQQ